MGRVLREITLWWQAFCLNAPGAIGLKLRRRLFLKEMDGHATNVVVGPGTFVRGWENISFGENFNVGNRCIFESAFGTITFGQNASLNSGVVFSADHGSITIGNDVLIGMNVVMRAAGHNYKGALNTPINRQGHAEGTIVIHDNVWIGANATILPGAHIESNCVIGAGAVVSGHIPEGSVAVGVPAKVVKKIDDR